MIFERRTECFVWVWLPGKTEPVVAGRLARRGDDYEFTYGRRYLQRPDAVSLYDTELPLVPGMRKCLYDGQLFGCLRDASPDAWGRRVVLNRLAGEKGHDADTALLDEITYLLHSGSDRIGALDFQESPDEYRPRTGDTPSLGECMDLKEYVDAGKTLPKDLSAAAVHATSIGGARPKVFLDAGGKKYIAKFASSKDSFDVIKSEYIGMKLAKACGLRVAEVMLDTAKGRDVLLVERFDRIPRNGTWERRQMLSALTLLGLSETTPQYASYEDLAEIIRVRFEKPKETLHELYARMVFNCLIGNTDDHARNHAAFWDGKSLSLTPAYDICPQMRSGGEATQAMMISGYNRFSQMTVCIRAARSFMLTEKQASHIIDRQIDTIRTRFVPLCREVGLNETDAGHLGERVILSPFTLDGYGGGKTANNR